jgi:hypothetical protein
LKKDQGSVELENDCLPVMKHLVAKHPPTKSYLADYYAAIMKEAKKQKDANEKIKEQLESFKTIDFEENWEAKIHLYHKLKELLEYKPTTLSKA